MEILFTFIPKEEQQQRLTNEFPDIEFHFLYKDKTRLPTADIVVTYGEDLKEEDIRIADNLKWIMVASAGVEKMPHKAIIEKNIMVSNVRGIHKTPMSESVLAHLLALKRSLPGIYENQRNSTWSRRISSSELAGSTALILGPGAIGSEIARLLQAFGVKTLGCNRSGNPVEHIEEIIMFKDISQVLHKADIVISVLPSTKETKGLFQAEHFKSMKPSAIFMNFGRGDLVQDDVLLEALANDEIAYAVLDVFEQEPLPAEHPYWSMENVIVSPHVSSHSGQYVERTLDIFIPNLKKWLDQGTQPSNLVNIEKGY